MVEIEPLLAVHGGAEATDALCSGYCCCWFCCVDCLKELTLSSSLGVDCSSLLVLVSLLSGEVGVFLGVSGLADSADCDGCGMSS